MLAQAEKARRSRRQRCLGDGFPGNLYEQDKTVPRSLCLWRRESNRVVYRMSTYLVALIVVTVFYGLFWHNRSARELDDTHSNRNPGASPTGILRGQRTNQSKHSVS